MLRLERRERRSLLLAAVVSAVALAYNNVLHALPRDIVDGVEFYATIVLAAALLGVALAAGLRAPLLGLAPRYAPASALLGFAVAGVLALTPVLFILLVPFVTGDPVQAEGITDATGGELAFTIAVAALFGTAIPEEVIARGVVFGLWLRAAGVREAFVASSLVYALWHAAVTTRSIAGAGVVAGPLLVTLGLLVSLAALFVGGLFFAFLRWRTSSIAAPIAVHWLVLAAIEFSLWIRA